MESCPRLTRPADIDQGDIKTSLYVCPVAASATPHRVVRWSLGHGILSCVQVSFGSYEALVRIGTIFTELE